MNNQAVSDQILRSFQSKKVIRSNHSLFGNVQQPIRVKPAPQISPVKSMSVAFSMAGAVLNEHNLFGQPFSQWVDAQEPETAPVPEKRGFVLPKSKGKALSKAA